MNWIQCLSSKILLKALDDTEESSAVGSAIVLKNFIRLKGSELFHAVPELVHDSLLASVYRNSNTTFCSLNKLFAMLRLQAIADCATPRAKAHVLKALVALTAHHQKSVCNEMLATQIPFQAHIIEFWQCVGTHAELSNFVIDYFLGILSSSCLYEVAGEKSGPNTQNVATHQSFAIFCVLNEILQGKNIHGELKKRFPELFAVFLASIATYTNLALPNKSPTTSPSSASSSPSAKATNPSIKSKFSLIPSKENVKMSPCQVVLDAFKAYLRNIEMEQLEQVLVIHPDLASSTDLNKFMEILTPMAAALVGQLGISSTAMKQVVDAVADKVASPYESERIAAVGLYSQLIPQKPTGELCSVVMLHLNSALGDSSPLVRGFCVRGMAYVGNLNETDVDKYSEMSLGALLKGIDDNNTDCFINIPLESMRGLSRIVMALHKDKLESFQVSLSIRIRRFMEHSAADIREAAILLFGDLCRIKTADYGTRCKSPVETMTPVSDQLREQIFSNFFSLFLHLSEIDAQIVRVCIKQYLAN